MVVFTSSSSSFFLAAVCFSPAADAAEYFVSPKIANERSSSFYSIFCHTNCANRSSFSFGREGETDTHTKVGTRSVSSPFLPRALAGERRKGTIQGLPRSSIETPGGHTHTQTIAFLLLFLLRLWGRVFLMIKEGSTFREEKKEGGDSAAEKGKNGALKEGSIGRMILLLPGIMELFSRFFFCFPHPFRQISHLRKKGDIFYR